MADFNQLNLPAIYGAAADVQGMQLRNQLVQDQIGRDAAFRNQLAQVLQNSPGGVASMTPQQTSQLYALDPERAAQFSQFQAQQNALAVAQRKQQAEQVVASADYVLQSKAPKTLAEMQFPQFKQDYDAHHGDGSWDQLSDDDVRQMAEGLKAHFGSMAGIEPPQPVKLDQGSTLVRPNGSGGYDTVASAAPKPLHVEHVDLGDRVQVVDPATGQVIREIPKGITPTAEANLNKNNLSDEQSALQAAMDSAGVSLSGGTRSPQLQKQRLQGLLDRNPGKTPDEIADGVRTGQLDFNGAKRSTAQLSTLSAAADVQSRKIEKDLASLRPIVQRLPNGPAKLANLMTNLQKDWSWNGDKDSTQAVGYIKELAGEYAKIVSGSTGMAAPAEGEMKSALGLMQSALTKNGFDGMHEFLTTTSQNRRDSVREGLQRAAARGTSTGSSPADQPQSGPVRVTSDADYAKLPSGTEFIAPDGSHRRKP